jgi:hypothetical protein
MKPNTSTKEQATPAVSGSQQTAQTGPGPIVMQLPSAMATRAANALWPDYAKRDTDGDLDAGGMLMRAALLIDRETAAPELLAALKALQASILSTSMHRREFWPADMTDSLESARAAIAKATR